MARPPPVPKWWYCLAWDMVRKMPYFYSLGVYESSKYSPGWVRAGWRFLFPVTYRDEGGQTGVVGGGWMDWRAYAGSPATVPPARVPELRITQSSDMGGSVWIGYSFISGHSAVAYEPDARCEMRITSWVGSTTTLVMCHATGTLGSVVLWWCVCVCVIFYPLAN